MSTWYSKHVEESNNIWRINNIQCITLVVLYGQILQHSQTQSFFIPIRLWRWNNQCSKRSAYKIQTPGNYPEKSIQQVYSGCNLDLLFPAPIRTVHISLYRHPATSPDHRHIQPCITAYDELFYFPFMSARVICYQPSCHDCFIIKFTDAKTLLQRCSSANSPWDNRGKSRFLTIRKVNWLSDQPE